MKIVRPKRTVLRIAADEYTMVVTKDPPRDHANGTHLNGQCMPDDRRLEVQAFPEPLHQLWVAYHEIVHAIDAQYHVGLTEAQVDQLAHPLASVLWDNIPFWMQMGLLQHPDNAAIEEEHCGCNAGHGSRPTGESL